MATPGFAHDFLMIPLGHNAHVLTPEMRRVVCVPTSSSMTSDGRMLVSGRANSRRVYPVSGPYGERLDVMYSYTYSLTINPNIEWVEFETNFSDITTHLEGSLKDLRGTFSILSFKTGVL